MSVEVPHFAQSFSIGRDGAAVVEQDSDEDKAACVYRIAVCPQGFREDLPGFGRPQLPFERLPLDLAALEAAVLLWEPRADLTVAEQLDALNEAVTVDVEVS
jgi:hypothetical protein